MADMKRVAVLVNPVIAYYRGILRGIIHYARGSDPWIIRNAGVKGYTLPELVKWRPHGIIALVASNSMLDDLRRLGKPLVNVSGALSRAAVPRVGVDNHAAGAQAARHFLDNGFRNFAFVGFPRLEFSNQRLAGFRDALKRDGASDCAVFDEEQHWSEEMAEQPATVREALHQWLQSLPKPVAVLVYNDYRANRIAELCCEWGLDIPRQVALMGIDDDELECESAWPPLSSVRLPGEKVGYKAAGVLAQLMDGGPVPAEPILFPPLGVMARASTDHLAFEDVHLVSALRFIRRNLEKNITHDEIVRASRGGHDVVEDRFQTILGRSSEDELERLRVEKAKSLLVRSQLTTLEVAQRVGFERFEDFNRAFKRWARTTPLGFREEFRK